MKLTVGLLFSIEGPFTVLAPNNDAFAKIPKEDLDALLANVPELKKKLLTHVISGKVVMNVKKKGQRTLR